MAPQYRLLLRHWRDNRSILWLEWIDSGILVLSLLLDGVACPLDTFLSATFFWRGLHPKLRGNRCCGERCGEYMDEELWCTRRSDALACVGQVTSLSGNLADFPTLRARLLSFSLCSSCFQPSCRCDRPSSFSQFFSVSLRLAELFSAQS